LNLPRFRLIAWLSCAGLFCYLYYSRPDFFDKELRSAAAISMIAAYGIYLLFGSIRGLTFIPSVR